MSKPSGSNKSPGYPPAAPAPPYEPSPQAPYPITSPAVIYPARYGPELMTPCAYGYHDPMIEFGLCGILAAIFCFPIGFICLCLDTERRCARCGVLC